MYLEFTSQLPKHSSTLCIGCSIHKKDTHLIHFNSIILILYYSNIMSLLLLTFLKMIFLFLANALKGLKG